MESTAQEKKIWTSEELFAFPDDGIDRWLIRGELRTSEDPEMTKRNTDHAGANAAIAFLLGAWVRTLPKPRGRVFDGEAYFRLKSDPETNVGIDVAYASAEQVARLPRRGAKFIDGPPILAVEILSPGDKKEDIDEKIDAYLSNGTSVVWIVDPFLATFIVHRPNSEPVMFSRSQELSGDPELPGFRCQVAEIFE